MNSKVKWAILLISMAAALSGTWWYRSRGVSAASVEKELLTVQQVDFPLIVNATGVLEAGKSVSIGPPRIQGGRGMGGGMSRFKISRMTDEGKQVSEGDFLLEFDGADIDRNLRDVTANFQKEQQRYQKKRSDFDMQVRDLSYQVDQAKADAEKIANKLQSQVELESALTVEEAKLRLTVARKKAELLEKKLGLLRESGRLDLQISLSNERAYKNLMETLLDAKDSLTITAPVPGVVIYKRGWDGEAKQVGSFANGPQDIVIELPDLSTLRAKINVDEVDFNKIEVGEPCDIQVQAVKGRLFKGKISSISAILKLASYDRAQKIAEVMLSLEGNAEEDVKLLRPGMSAVASIQVGSFPKAIVIPLSSILERDGRSIVQVWNGEKKEFEWRDVLLATNDGLSAVIKQGLQANERIRIKPKA
jgi:HlyD family secretion protein